MTDDSDIIEPQEGPTAFVEEAEESAYKITLPVFHGPLDLLLHLIKQHKIDIYDIPIMLVTEQYNHYLESMEELDLEVAADFIYMAAVLIHIKSKMLLPRDEDNPDQDDPRSELVDRLLEYQKFKSVAETFSEMDVLRMGVWARQPGPKPGVDASELDLSEVSLFDLIDAFRGALVRYKHEHPQSIELKRSLFKISEKMSELREALRERSPIRLQWYLEGRERAELVAIFLALLELVRLGGISLRQTELFGEILVHDTGKELDAAQFEMLDK